MAYDASNLINKEFIPGLCPFCDNAIEAFDSCRVVEAHGLRFLVHEICLDTAEDEEDEDNDEPDTEFGKHLRPRIHPPEH